MGILSDVVRNRKRALRFAVLGVLLLLAIMAAGCEKRPGSLERLEGKSIGVIVTVDDERWADLGSFLVSYLQRKLTGVTVKDSEYIQAALNRYGVSDAQVNDSDVLRKLRDDVGVDYLLAVSLTDINDGDTTARVEVGTKRSNVSTSVRTTVTLAYTLYDAGNGQRVLSGKQVGESEKILGLKVGSDGYKFGVRVVKESDLAGEALLDAVKKTGWF